MATGYEFGSPRACVALLVVLCALNEKQGDEYAKKSDGATSKEFSPLNFSRSFVACFHGSAAQRCHREPPARQTELSYMANWPFSNSP